MKLLDKPLTASEKDDVLRMLEGCKNRLCISDDLEEIMRMAGFASDYIFMLAYSRMKEVKLNAK